MRPGQKIGAYRIGRVIGAGGMGTVYEAQQKNPNRTVALKVLRAGLATADAQRRFEYEVEVLARLRHPGIAAIYEAGTHENGSASPWFAMEYVSGARTLTEYATQENLGPRERLALFEQVCAAVHHGHLRGVIHRDLKPENILVDTQGQVKIIDFGVARATEENVSARTRLTTQGQLVGTLQYMSPEQIESDPRDLDVRTDVYSLGVVLYELLTDRLPYTVRNEALLDSVSAILTQRPAPMTTSEKPFSMEFELVVAKALAKEREQRYPSALGLREDLEHLRTGEPVSARPPSVGYQLRVFARRNKAIVGAALAVTASLLIGLVVSLTLYVGAEKAREAEVEAKMQARDAQRRAEIARREEARQHAQAVEQRKRAEANERLAAHEAKIAQAVNAFLNQDVLAMASPDNTPNRELTVREALDRSAERIEARFPDAPLVEAQIRHTLAETYIVLGLRKKGEPHLKRSLLLRREHLGVEHTKTIKTLGDLGGLQWYLGHREEARALTAEAAEASARVTGPESRETLGLRQSLAFMTLRLGRAAEAEKILSTLVEPMARVFGEDDKATLMALSSLAEARADLGDVDEAIETLRGLVKRVMAAERPDHPYVLTVMQAMGFFLNRAKRYAEAEQVFRTALDEHATVLGAEHPSILTTTETLGQALMGQGKGEEAIALLRKVLEARRRLLGPAHPHTHSSYHSLLQALWAAGQRSEAVSLLEGAVRDQIEAQGPGHRQSLVISRTLAQRYEANGQMEDAAKQYRRVLEAARSSRPRGEGAVIELALRLARCLRALKRPGELEAVLLKAWEDAQPPASAGAAGRDAVASQLTDLFSSLGRESETELWRARAVEAKEAAKEK